MKFLKHIYINFSRDNGLLTELSSSLYFLTILFQVLIRIRDWHKMGWYFVWRSWSDGITNLYYILLVFAFSSPTHFGAFMYKSEWKTCLYVYDLSEWHNAKWWELMKCSLPLLCKKVLCKLNLMDSLELSRL